MTWLPFDLHPEYPPEGILRTERHGRVEPVFRENGLEYAPPPDVVPNSFAALRLAELARDLGRHREAHDRLMDAYWAESRDIGDHDELRSLAAELDLPADDVERVLAGGEFSERVRASTAQAVSIGVTGVPGFLLGGRLLVLGAQPLEVFEQAAERLEAEPDS